MIEDLVAFLNARLDEDEASALAAESDGAREWSTTGEDSGGAVSVTDSNGDAVVFAEGAPTIAEAEHIARHDPARVLREVAAKRAIIAAMEEDNRCLARGYTDLVRGAQLASFMACRHFAAVYSDHPDYRPEWAV